jgi:hypothetical protein
MGGPKQAGGKVTDDGVSRVARKGLERGWTAPYLGRTCLLDGPYALTPVK